MKVKIGRYQTYIGPYKIAEKLLFWKSKDDPLVDRVSDVIMNSPLLMRLIEIINNRRRQIKVVIDDHDIWNMDHTLALIITPMLKKIRDNKHSSGMVDDEDIPEELGIRNSQSAKSEQDPFMDVNVHARWEWVLGEMIWAFENILDDDSEEKFYTDNKDKSILTMNVDRDGLLKHQERIRNGLQLFGKYYQGLWT